MNIIEFPGINLKLEISKIAFSMFGIDVYYYSICIVTGIIVALLLARFSKEKFDINFDTVLDNTIIGLIFGIIGARLYFVLFSLEHYSKNILEIFNLRDGGLAIYGEYRAQ